MTVTATVDGKKLTYDEAQAKWLAAMAEHDKDRSKWLAIIATDRVPARRILLAVIVIGLIQIAVALVLRFAGLG